ncbi:MAG: flavocytochrome c [Treponema sp.]|nr:flavocytochrome c [Treponema sp.]
MTKMLRLLGVMAILAAALGLATACATQAGGRADPLRADIVVIGAGGAGVAAALQAYQDGAVNIVILEQMPMIGGNTLLATGRMNAANTRYQPAGSDSTDLMFDDTMRGGGNINNPAQVRILVDQSAEAVYWLNDNFGTGITRIGRGGGASAPRSHGTETGAGIGSVVMPALGRALSRTSIYVMLNTRATEILVGAGGNITGVAAQRGNERLTIATNAVILASGGFGANPEMLVRWDSALLGFGTTNHVGATGSGIEMAHAIGAGLVDMEQIQTHPTAHPTGTLLTEAMRGEGSILVNMEGQRFVNELSTRDVVSEATLAQTDSFAYMVFDSRIRGRLAIIEDYIRGGIITMAPSPRELAEALGIPPAALEATISRYNAFAAAGADADFNRMAPLHRIDGPQYYAVVTIPSVHHTMGGVTINTRTEVLNAAGNVIPGLFAAGEVVGGTHGNNRLGGNAITEVVVFGRIAGTNAVEFVRNTAGLAQDPFAPPAAAVLAIVPGARGNFSDGVFEGTANGYSGPLSVRVTVQSGYIVSIELFNHHETPIIYEAAERGVTAAIIRTQSTNVDTVTGATLTSNGIIGAVSHALGL